MLAWVWSIVVGKNARNVQLKGLVGLLFYWCVLSHSSLEHRVESCFYLTPSFHSCICTGEFTHPSVTCKLQLSVLYTHFSCGWLDILLGFGSCTMFHRFQDHNRGAWGTCRRQKVCKLFTELYPDGGEACGNHGLGAKVCWSPNSWRKRRDIPCQRSDSSLWVCPGTRSISSNWVWAEWCWHRVPPNMPYCSLFLHLW